MNNQTHLHFVAKRPMTSRAIDLSTSAQRDISFSDDYVETRDTVLKTGLPFLYVERGTGQQNVLLSPVGDYSPEGCRGGPTNTNRVVELECNSALISKTYPIFLEAKSFVGTILVGEVCRKLFGASFCRCALRSSFRPGPSFNRPSASRLGCRSR